LSFFWEVVLERGFLSLNALKAGPGNALTGAPSGAGRGGGSANLTELWCNGSRGPRGPKPTRACGAGIPILFLRLDTGEDIAHDHTCPTVKFAHSLTLAGAQVCDVNSHGGCAGA
jgi:hypothetical protein